MTTSLADSATAARPLRGLFGPDEPAVSAPANDEPARASAGDAPDDLLAGLSAEGQQALTDNPVALEILRVMKDPTKRAVLQEAIERGLPLEVINAVLFDLGWKSAAQRRLRAHGLVELADKIAAESDSILSVVRECLPRRVRHRSTTTKAPRGRAVHRPPSGPRAEVCVEVSTGPPGADAASEDVPPPPLTTAAALALVRADPAALADLANALRPFFTPSPATPPQPKRTGRPRRQPTEEQVRAYRTFHAVDIGACCYARTAWFLGWVRYGKPDRAKAYKAVQRVEKWQQAHGLPSTAPGRNRAGSARAFPEYSVENGQQRGRNGNVPVSRRATPQRLPRAS